MADTSIFARLKADHDRHRALIEQIESDQANRAELFETFRVEVTAHAAAEEETLYATMLARPALRHDAQHSVAEHKEIEDHLSDLVDGDPSSDVWMSRFRQMRHRYLHHIDEEEEDMFPAASEDLSDAEVEALADRFADRKPAELERAEAGPVEDERD